MDFALPDLLNREDIINIFNQRQLHIPHMNELTLDELLRVYKTFAMPLSKRPDRNKKVKQVTHNMCARENENNDEHNIYSECSDSSSNAMDIDFFSAETNHESAARMQSPVGEKRRQRCNEEDIFDMLINDYQYQLTSVTKRIRINSVS